jgi:hypothetical protein
MLHVSVMAIEGRTLYRGKSGDYVYLTGNLDGVPRVLVFRGDGGLVVLEPHEFAAVVPMLGELSVCPPTERIEIRTRP